MLIKDKFHEEAAAKEKLFRTLLRHPAIKEIRGKGLMLAVEFNNEELCKKAIEICLKKGIIVDWFLFCPTAMRIAPPLIIQEKDVKRACGVIISAIDEAKVYKGKSS